MEIRKHVNIRIIITKSHSLIRLRSFEISHFIVVSIENLENNLHTVNRLKALLIDTVLLPFPDDIIWLLQLSAHQSIALWWGKYYQCVFRRSREEVMDIIYASEVGINYHTDLGRIFFIKFKRKKVFFLLILYRSKTHFGAEINRR